MSSMSLLTVLSSVLLFALLLLPSALAVTPVTDQGIVFPVWVSVSFNKISKVDGVEQLFRSDFYMQTFWIDPSLQPSNGVFKNSTFDPAATWTPQLEFVNANDAVTLMTDAPYYYTSTPEFVQDSDLTYLGFNPADRDTLVWIIQDARFIGEFLTPLQLQEFPFDQQKMFLHIESLYTVDELDIRFSDLSKLPDIIPRAETIGWNLLGSRYEKTIYTYVTLGGSQYSRLSLGVGLEREPQYFLMKIVLGCILLVLMGIWCFSLAVDEPDRMMGTLTVFAGLVTFLFVATQDLPKIPYQTRIDTFFNFSFFIVAISLFTHGLLYYFREEEEVDHEKTAHAAVSATIRRLSTSPVPHNMAPQDNRVRVAPLDPSIHTKAFETAPVGNDMPPAPPKTLTGKFFKWWEDLVPTRKWDAICISTLFTTYMIGCAIILGRPATNKV